MNSKKNNKTIILDNKVEIPYSELEWSYVRSSGPGGQNVNRTNSCVILRWNYLNSKLFIENLISEEDREKLKAITTKSGELIIKSQSFRDQDQNYEDCLTKFRRILNQIFYKPKKRIPTKPTFSSKQRRLKSKALKSDKKASRSKKFN